MAHGGAVWVPSAQAKAGALDSGAPLEEAQISGECSAGRVQPPSLLRRLDLQQLPCVLQVLEHPSLFSAAARLLDVEEAVTTAYKWLRAVPPGAFTGPHMRRKTVDHALPRFRDYRRAGGDGERSGWLAPDPGLLELPPASRGWHSTDFAAGDVAVFGMDLLHTTVPNTTRSFRLSCDTRWQPAAAPPPAGVTVGPWRREARLRAAAAAAARRPSEPASDGSPAPRAEVVGAAPGRMGPPGAEFDPPHRLAKRCCQSSSVASALWTAQAAADGRASAD
ncbi:unnamed protein product [Prorocentrum cordatum]|uniref:Phytanoyl-dioxygenase n=1 Tax=Prorocentrum cordatum TaxID=2364126 RepID=A0ABN9V0N7_9DINO|nr:unnamed protein product [Polarella glacialis]